MSKKAFELLIGIISRSGKERISLFEHEGYFQVESFNLNDSLTLYEFGIQTLNAVVLYMTIC